METQAQKVKKELVKAALKRFGGAAEIASEIHDIIKNVRAGISAHYGGASVKMVIPVQLVKRKDGYNVAVCFYIKKPGVPILKESGRIGDYLPPGLASELIDKAAFFAPPKTDYEIPMFIELAENPGEGSGIVANFHVTLSEKSINTELMDAACIEEKLKTYLQ